MSLFVKKKELDIEYRDEYFYIMNSWWTRTKDGHINTCYRVAVEYVPADYIEHWNKES